MTLQKTPPRKIFIVDDHVIYREGIMSLFRFSDDFEVVGGAGNVQSAIAMAAETRPEIILMDYSLPDGTGLDCCRSILQILPECKIIFLTITETDTILFSALRAGAKGYLLKSISGADLLASLRSLDREEVALSRKMISRVVEEFAQTSAGSSGVKKENEELLSRLSQREIDVLRELEVGKTNEEIAENLFLSPNTVKHHIHSIFEKLRIANRREAAIVARQLGLV